MIPTRLLAALLPLAALGSPAGADSRSLEPDYARASRWWPPGRTSRFENVPTVFGPVDLIFGLSEGGVTLEVTFRGRFHHPPERVVLHVPPLKGIESVVVNGQKTAASPGQSFALRAF